ncbi:MAG: hypothetical protein QUS14_18555, partial [Pyrinomonadaceae bacterium]|nr:hypothetical protein [Pyrinomonadaceae bacterium]
MKHPSYTPRLKRIALVSALTITAAGIVVGALPATLRETFAAPIVNILFSDPTPASEPVAQVQNLVPIVSTDKTGYLAGEDIVITAAGFLPSEAVTINLSRSNGEPVQTRNVIADEAGQAIVTWSIDPNDRGLNDFTVMAEGPSGPTQTEFSRIAVIHPNKFKFEPGETVFVRGAGFRPEEDVLLEITRVNLDGTNTPKEPFYLRADETGGISAEWAVDPEDADGAIYRMVARGLTSSIVDASVLGTGSTFLESPMALNLISEPITDDGGPDDYSGQKDLTQLQEDDGPDYFAIAWNWDDTAWTGGNTGDACALIDTDADGNANYAFCVTVHGKPAHLIDDTFYSCGDARADRCSQQTVPVTHSATSGVSLEEADPFSSDPEHTTGNHCKDFADGTFPYDCRSWDTVASVSIPRTDLGGATDPHVVNVCSYPSQEPNSDPSDCVFNPQNGFLVITKVADPDDGTAFVFTPSRPSQTGATSWTINGSGSTPVISYSSTSTVDLSETVPTGWSLDSASCSINTATPTSTGTFSGTSITGISIQPGLTTTCVFNDSLQTGTLIVEKVVINDNGGTATADDFSFQVDGGTAVPFEADGSNSITVEAGTYNVTEPAFTGYSTTYNNCTNVVVPAGGTATCTITNDDQAATLIVKKIVVNDNGGNAVASDFTFQVNGGTAVPFEADGQNDLTVSAGTYSVVEPAVAGYSTSYDNCTSLEIPNGGTATCTITNNDVAPTLTLIKSVVNDNGGNAQPNDFLLTIGGTAATSGVAYPLDANTAYAINETQLSGYSFVNITGDPKCPAVLGGTVTLDEAENVTCTITNNDIAPQLTIIKHVINDNGGTASAADFTLDSGGVNDTPDDFEGSETGTVVTLDAGAYGVNEVGPAGYAASFSADCSGTIAVGQSKTCTVTNNDIAPTLTVIKYIYPSSDTGKFNLQIDGVTYATDVGHTGTTGAVAVNAGTHTVSETAGTGTDLSNYIPVIGGACASNGDVSLALAESKVCTIINTRRASLTIVKSTEGGDGTFDFTSVKLGNFSLTTSANTASTTFPNLEPGFFAVSEVPEDGWDALSAVCSDGSAVSNIGLSPGESVTCTFTNRQRGRVNVLKTVNGSPDPDLDVEFQLLEGTTMIEALPTLEDADGMLNFTTDLVPGTTYTMCEIRIPAGFGFTWTYNSDPVTPYNPDDPVDNRNRCYDFSVTAGQTAEFAVNNTQPLLVSKSAATTYTRTHLWDINKAATPAVWNMFTGDNGTTMYDVSVQKTGFNDSNWAVTGTITILNPSKVAATIESVTDVVSDAGAANVDCGVTFPYTLAAENSLSCSYQANLPDAASRTNTATVVTSGPVPGGSGNAAVAFGDPTNVVNDSINVTDTNGGSWNFSDTTVVSYTRTFACSTDDGTHNNTAMITETGQSASASVEVNCYDLSVSKTAQTSLTRTFDWTIDKSVDDNSFDLFKGESATANYTVRVDKTSTDSDWAVAGTITISNPAPVAASLTNVIDVVSPGISAAVDCSGSARGLGVGYAVPAGSNLVCTYQAVLEDAADRTNTATARLQNFNYNSAGDPTPDGTTDFNGSAAVSFASATVSVVGFNTVNVTDDIAGNLGTTSDNNTWNYPDTVSYTHLTLPTSSE